VSKFDQKKQKTETQINAAGDVVINYNEPPDGVGFDFSIRIRFWFGRGGSAAAKRIVDEIAPIVVAASKWVIAYKSAEIYATVGAHFGENFPGSAELKSMMARLNHIECIAEDDDTLMDVPVQSQ